MIAERVRGITPFLAMEVLERAQKLEREGASIIHLELGEPDFDTPECIRQAAFKALDGRAMFVVAGAPACMDDLKAVGIENFIHVRTDQLQTLKEYNTKLGIK